MLTSMMSIALKRSEIIGLVTLLIGGLSAVAYAQAPALSLPPLPGQPSAPSAPVMSAPSMPSLPTTANASKIGEVNVGAMDVTGKKDADISARVALDPPPLPNESGDKSASITGLPPLPGGANAIPELPTLNVEAPLPAGVSIGTATNIAQPALPLPVSPQPEPVKEVKKEPVKTWTTTLAPSVTIPKLDFNYRRERLPGEIYRSSYTLDNRHLPVAVTTDDYMRLFLVSVARNDINATRAFLNRGMPVNATNANGETALALARRYGAVDTAQLLVLRGAQ